MGSNGIGRLSSGLQREGNLAQVRELLAADVPLDEADEYGWTALGAACAKRHREIARVLMRAGAAVDSRDGAASPIQDAAAGGDLDLVKQLVAAGADASGAVDAAANDGQVHVLRWLVEDAGADVDELIDGMTPLMSAAEAGKAEVVRELIRLGADPVQTFGGGRRSRTSRPAWDMRICRRASWAGRCAAPADMDEVVWREVVRRP